MDFLDVLAGADWAGLLIDVLIPVAAILVPTLIAIRLSRTERQSARQEREEARVEAAKERRLRAAADVLVSLGHLISLDVVNAPMQERLGELRGRIAVYRAWIDDDDLSGDWLALKHREGMRLWHRALEDIDEVGGIHADSFEYVEDVLTTPRLWAQRTIDTFSGWLSGHVDLEVLRAEGAELLAEFGDADDGDRVATW